MADLIFLKLGGSLLTDKTGNEALRPEILTRVAHEIATARTQNPELRLLLGHGSGSFGHVAGAKHGTRGGVANAAQWFGFAEVADAAARLNRHVVAALLAAGVPAVGMAPSASTQVDAGRIRFMATQPIESALDAGIVPVVFGDVAFDLAQGGTIISTEEVMDYLAIKLPVRWLLLAGETAGVLDGEGRVLPLISRASLPVVLPSLGASRGTDVTGGMAAKVLAMIALVESVQGLSVRIFSGLEDDLLVRLLSRPDTSTGTLLQ